MSEVDKLAHKLERATEKSIDWIEAILAVPLDIDNPHLLRAQVTATGVALQAQIKADSMRLRSIREDKALAALLALIASKERVLPPWPRSNDVGLGRHEGPVVVGNGLLEEKPVAASMAESPLDPAPLRDANGK